MVIPPIIGAPIGLFNRAHLLEFLSLAENQCMTAMGDRIKRLREAMGISQSELARRIEISQPSLWDIEEGETKTLRAKTLHGLCRELHTTPGYLLDDQGAVEDVDLPAMESELVFTIRNLQPELRLALLEYARFLLKKQPGAPVMLKPAKLHPVKAATKAKKAASKPAAKR